jgi:hypothetical protein
MNGSELSAGFTLGAFLMFFLMMSYPMQCVKKEEQQQAVDHNAASWVVDQKTGETTFKWKGEVK